MLPSTDHPAAPGRDASDRRPRRTAAAVASLVGLALRPRGLRGTEEPDDRRDPARGLVGVDRPALEVLRPDPRVVVVRRGRVRDRAGAARLRGPVGRLDRARARAVQGVERGPDRLAAAQPRRPRGVGRRLPRAGQGHGQQGRAEEVRPRRLRPAGCAALDPGEVRERRRAGQAVRVRRRLLDRRGHPARDRRVRRLRRGLPEEHRSRARSRRHGQRRTRPRHPAVGARRRQAALPRLQLRHRARRHVRGALPDDGRAHGPRRCAAADADHRRGLGGPGRRLRGRPARLRDGLPGGQGRAR